jgi:hypothetical protein
VGKSAFARHRERRIQFQISEIFEPGQLGQVEFEVRFERLQNETLDLRVFENIKERLLHFIADRKSNFVERGGSIVAQATFKFFEVTIFVGSVPIVVES